MRDAKLLIQYFKQSESRAEFMLKVIHSPQTRNDFTNPQIDIAWELLSFLEVEKEHTTGQMELDYNDEA